MNKVTVAGMLVLLASFPLSTSRAAEPEATYTPPLSDATLNDLRQLYVQLIDAEDVHDLHKVQSMLFTSPVSLFISRMAPVAKGNWGGYWGTSSIVHHFSDLYSGAFRIDPNYSQEKIVGLTPDVAETYAPVLITSSYGGQPAAARRFLMVLEWVKTPDGWKVATDIPMPIPPAPKIVP